MTPTAVTAAELARRLAAARRDRTAIGSLSEDTDFDLETAYRYRDYRFTMTDVVADNASAGRFVVVATASGAASLGHPAAAVA